MRLPALLLAAACLAAALAAEEPARRHGLEIEITQPADGSFQFGRTEITAEVRAADPEGVERVEFFVDGVLIFIDQEPPYRCVFDFGGEPRSRVVKAVAQYAGGVSVADTVITRRVVVHYEVAVDRVLLSAIVTPKEGSGAGTLPDFLREDFHLVEDGVPQEILEVSPERRPLALALLIDTSGSMVEGMKMVHEAATRCVESLRPEDRVAVIDFDTNVYLLSGFTQDREDSKASIRSTFADGGTALYDALNASFRLLAEVSGPKAIILLSDGEDTDSRLDLDRVVEKARTSDTIVYSVGLGTGMLDVGLRGVLKDLSEGTGGRAFFPDNLNELDSVYRSIAQELTNDRYLLSYAPTNTDWNGAWREVSLSLNQKGYRVRTRKGYYAVR
ncbi:MAG: VWA domain-containing protein [Acidobacteria bacterium]|nr:VWA domain-containing protein [Acidobacteriota bacterium]